MTAAIPLCLRHRPSINPPRPAPIMVIGEVVDVMLCGVTWWTFFNLDLLSTRTRFVFQSRHKEASAEEKNYPTLRHLMLWLSITGFWINQTLFQCFAESGAISPWAFETIWAHAEEDKRHVEREIM